MCSVTVVLLYSNSSRLCLLVFDSLFIINNEYLFFLILVAMLLRPKYLGGGEKMHLALDALDP